MEILTNSSSPTLISNKEVLDTLKKNETERLEHESKRRKAKKGKSRFQHRDWIEGKVIEYLNTTPCAHLKDFSSMQGLQEKLISSKQQRTSSAEDKATGSTSTGFGLTDAEALQIVNFMPTEPVEIHLMIEELHARMSEPRQEELIQVIKSYRSDIADSEMEQQEDTENSTSNVKTE